MFHFRRLFVAVLVLSITLIAAGPVSAHRGVLPDYTFATPVFGLAAARDGSLLVADAGAGIVQLRKGEGKLFAELPGVTDVATTGRSSVLAITGAGEAPNPGTLFRVSRGNIQPIADLIAFEAEVNPDGGEIDSNPFDVAGLYRGKALVADAGGNSLLIVDMNGNVDWVATLPDELVSTENAKTLAGCPDPISPELQEQICALPDMIPSQAVASSVAVGPDGAYYVGELKGFPGPLGESRIWRIEPGTLHAECGVSPACTVVADGFTSIVDLTFDRRGTLYVTEFDEASFLAIELSALDPSLLVGGTINACDSETWSCEEVATELTMPIATAVDKRGRVYVAVSALMPDARVIALPK